MQPKPNLRRASGARDGAERDAEIGLVPAWVRFSTSSERSRWAFAGHGKGEVQLLLIGEGRTHAHVASGALRRLT